MLVVILGYLTGINIIQETLTEHQIKHETLSSTASTRNILIGINISLSCDIHRYSARKILFCHNYFRGYGF
jgi:hypothetical protein